jgi:hypothetical protein
VEAGEELELPPPTQGELLIIYRALIAARAHALSITLLERLSDNQSDISLIKRRMRALSLSSFVAMTPPRLFGMCAHISFAA